MSEDRIDRYCNQIHIACIGLKRLKKQTPYCQDGAFGELVERFCRKAHELMHLIRATEGGGVPGEGSRWIALS